MNQGNDKNDRSGPSEAELAQALPEQAGSRDIPVGIFVVLGLVTFITLLFLLTDPSTFRGRYFITTAVEDVSGLRNGDPVQMRGVNIGRVRGASMVPSEDSVVVRLEIEGEWDIPTDSYAELLSGGLLAGGRIIEVRQGVASTHVPANGHIPGRVVRGVMENTDVLAERGEVLLDRLNALLSDSTVASVEGTLAEMNVLVGEVADIAQAQGDNIGELIESLQATSENLGEATGPEFRANVQSTVARADSTMRSLSDMSERLNSVSASLETILGRMERGEGTLGQLSVNDELYVNVTAAVASLQDLLTDFRENPGRYVNISIF